MLAVLRFLFFNVALSSTDVGTDLFTFLELAPDNPWWACLTLMWTVMPFFVRTAFFVYKKASGNCEACGTWSELLSEFYREVVVHLPFISSMHNIWRAKRLHDLNFGTKKFQMKDHKEVEKLLDEAGRCSQAESNYEAGPQSVTQVARDTQSFSTIFSNLKKIFEGGDSIQHWEIQHKPGCFALHLHLIAFLGSLKVVSFSPVSP